MIKSPLTQLIQGWLCDLESNLYAAAQLTKSLKLFRDFGGKMLGALIRVYSRAAQLAERSQSDSLFLNIAGVSLAWLRGSGLEYESITILH